MTFNRMLQWCDQDKDNGDFFRLTGVAGHRKRYKARGGWQVLVNWASGLSDWQDLNDTFESDPISVAVYAEKKGLLREPGWK